MNGKTIHPATGLEKRVKTVHFLRLPLLKAHLIANLTKHQISPFTFMLLSFAPSVYELTTPFYMENIPIVPQDQGIGC